MKLSFILISALFTELMEGMQQFYLNATLEADYAMARDRHLLMKHDPRLATPFESKEIFAPVSKIIIMHCTLLSI